MNAIRPDELTENKFKLALRTNLIDLLCGRVTGERMRLSTTQSIRDALPRETADFVCDIVSKTRLRRVEKREVAQELLDHFRECQSHGVDPLAAIEAFGKPGPAAKLIRRAKIRNRHFIERKCMQLIRFVATAIPVAIAIYLLLCVYYFMGSPTYATDYLVVANEKAAAVAPEDSGWPLYRSALLSMGYAPDETAPGYTPDEMIPGLPCTKAATNSAFTEEDWGAMRRILPANRKEIDTIIAASKKPGLGYILTPRVTEENLPLVVPESKREEYRKQSAIRQQHTHPYDNLPWYLGFAHLNPLDNAANVLVLEAWRGADAGEPERVVEMLSALPRIGLHAEEIDLAIGQLYAAKIYLKGTSAIRRLLQSYPDLLDEKQLTTLAHQYAMPDDQLELSFRGERVGIEAMAQSLYTDNGDGDGRILYRQLLYFSNFPRADFKSSFADALAANPEAFFRSGRGVFWMSRKEFVAESVRRLEKDEALAQQPLWKADNEAENLDWELRQMYPWERIKYEPIQLLTPSLSQFGFLSKQATATRDATLCIIAAHIYRMQRGNWPASLEDLVPTYMPHVPLDRYDGTPLKYRLVDGSPIFYSVGMDGDDDEGRMVEKQTNDIDGTGKKTYDAMAAATDIPINLRYKDRWQAQVARRQYDGDWRFWPLPMD